MTPSPGSLVRRLVVSAAIWAAVLMIAGALALTALYRQSALGAIDDRLESAVSALVAAVETGEDGELVLARQPSDPRFDQVFSGRYWQIGEFYDADTFRVIGRSRSLWDERLRPPDAFLASTLDAPGERVTIEMTGPDGEPLRIMAQAVLLAGRQDPAIMMAGEDRRPADRDVQRFASVVAGMFLIFAVALAIGIFLQVRVGLAPLFRMRDSVVDVREGRADRVEGAYPTEIQPLGDELNSLLDHSREVVDRARTHVGNLAHALKTPIAVLLNESRTDKTEFAELVGRQAEIMSRQVDHHLRRARAAAHAKSVGARTPVTPLINDLARTLTRIYGRKGIAINWTSPDELVFRGERQDLEEMVGNLMDNACKWAASCVTVSAGPGNSEQTLEIRIADDGPGMDAAAREDALKRGVRLDESAPGSGLGLSIVGDLAKVYGGVLALGEAEAGGLLACLTLPAAKDR
ncbi:sensor histidine kinase [Hyphobacterium marinum]|uniref:histidine kinase n=1 Tax=Hyphobacterium marinum TaxID=3116574 RepID=A0ABU7M1A5_9PROT|nr:sensor histidine kinase [Hyphobacterium sp. Y6023]MEE2567317.1 sensor histidine kinase [Hyphobacterium sp. Y6023]